MKDARREILRKLYNRGFGVVVQSEEAKKIIIDSALAELDKLEYQN